MLFMASENVQFNAVIPEMLAKKVRKEAIEHNVTLGDITSQALEKFFTLPIAQRRVILSESKKILGRKIAT